jgi:hypothetical protein
MLGLMLGLLLCLISLVFLPFYFLVKLVILVFLINLILCSIRLIFDFGYLLLLVVHLLLTSNNHNLIYLFC